MAKTSSKAPAKKKAAPASKTKAKSKAKLAATKKAAATKAKPKPAAKAPLAKSVQTPVAKKAPAKAKPVKAKAVSTTKAVKAKKVAPGKQKPSARALATKKPVVAKSPTKPKKSKTNGIDSVSAQSLTIHGLQPYQEEKNEDYMNDEQRGHFRQILLAWKRELMEEVDRTVSHMKDEAANFPDPADRATQEEEFSLELRTRDRERKLIKKIDKTLVRLDEDDYGYCDQCGVEIGIRRLEARPTANLCVDCKTLDEIREKQITGG